jgi:hypothetical protein
VLDVWDRAGIDFSQWQRWKKASGLYFLSREPSGANRSAAEIAHQTSALKMRANSLPPGSPQGRGGGRESRRSASRASRAGGRWQKVFGEFKNKLEEGQAWASSATAKTMQAQFLCLAHHLMLLCEDWLAREHGIRNQAEHRRRAQPVQRSDERLAAQNQMTPVLIRGHQRLTVRSVKFIRWLRAQLFESLHHAQPLALLASLYASL